MFSKIKNFKKEKKKFSNTDKNNKKNDNDIKDLDQYFINKRKKKVKILKQKKRPEFQGLPLYLERAGFSFNKERISLILFRIAVLINLVLSFYIIFRITLHFQNTINYLIILIAIVWTLVLIVIVFLVWLFFFVFIDVKIAKRKRQVEEVLPEYLLETATNVRSGMYLEKALWYTIKPKYGVLAKEMEMIAKQTMAGYELEESIRRFTKKYNSPTLTKSFELLLEGKNAGGEIADLLSDIGENIKEINVLKKEMASSVMTYATFITFASIVAAPFLFGLSHQLITIIGKVTSGIDVTSSATSQLGFNIGGAGINPSDFKLFAIVSLIFSALFSSLISSFLKEGNSQGFIKKFPIYAIIAIAVFYISSNMLSGFLSSLI